MTRVPFASFRIENRSLPKKIALDGSVIIVGRFDRRVLEYARLRLRQTDRKVRPATTLSIGIGIGPFGHFKIAQKRAPGCRSQRRL